MGAAPARASLFMDKKADLKARFGHRKFRSFHGFEMTVKIQS